MRNFKNKLQVIRNLYNGQLKQWCQKCNIGLEFLPALDFHHLYSEKSINWSDLRSRDVPEVIKILENEGISVLCSNCHSLELNYSSIFHYFKNFILDPNIFSYSPLDLNKKIDQIVLNSNNNFSSKERLKRSLKRNLKKRYIVETIFNGYCIGCQSVGVESLPALEFHHKDPSIKNHSWSFDLRDFKIPKILGILIDEDMICLCKNCHEMLNTCFNEISSEFFKQDIVSKIDIFYKTLISNIDSFRIAISNFNDPIDDIDKESDYYRERYFGRNL